MNSLNKESILDVIRQIKKGIYIEMPSYKNISCPNIDIIFHSQKRPTLKTGGMWFLSASKLNDLSQHDTKEIFLHIKGLEWPEDDLNYLRQEIERKVAKGSIQLKIHSHDESFPGEFYKKESRMKKSSNYIMKNIFYTHCYDNIGFSLLYPFFDIASGDSVCIVKFPTMVGGTVLDILWLLNYVSEKITIVKHKRDSWIKDSFMVICEGLDVVKVKEVKGKIKDSLGKGDYRKENRPFSFWNMNDIDEGFKNVWFQYVNAVHHAIYITHSLLVSSMTDTSQSVNNKYQDVLKKLSSTSKFDDIDWPDFVKVLTNVDFD